MTNGIAPLFQYLKSEHINLSKEEFSFQFESHPDFPSLLAISDTLNFFNITNAAIKVDFSEVEQLPDKFVASLNGNHLSFVENNNSSFSFINESLKKKKNISKEELKKIWGNIVLLAENNDDALKRDDPKKFSKFLLAPFIILLTIIHWFNFKNAATVFFYIFPVVGFVFSLGALKELFNTESKLLDKFCNASSNCNTIVKSSKWKLLKRLNFSDLSITFFSYQIIGLFIMGIVGLHYENFAIQFILLLLSIPVLILSIYYQKFVEEKWCPICLSIGGVVILELIYLLIFSLQEFVKIDLFSCVLSLFIYVSVLMIWFFIKNTLKKNNELENSLSKANRFKRNYSVFKNTLISKSKYNLPLNPMSFGNKEASLKIDIITSPYCGFCKDSHFMLENILKKHNNNLEIRILYNIDVETADKENKNILFKNLIHLNLENGTDAFHEALENWYENKDIDKWLQEYGSDFNQEKIDLILKAQNNWCTENKLNFTPCMFINGYKFPESYEISDFSFYIEEILEDKTI